jgi:hypothetical protein
VEDLKLAIGGIYGCEAEKRQGILGAMLSSSYEVDRPLLHAPAS